MAFYYNTTNGPVAFNLPNGDSCVLPPRLWVALEDTGTSPDLVRLLKRKVVLRQERARRELTSLPSSKPESGGTPAVRIPDAAPGVSVPVPLPIAPAPVVVEALPVPESQLQVVAAAEATASAPEVAVATEAEALPADKVVAPEESAADKAESNKAGKPYASSYRGNNYRRTPPLVSVPSSTTSAKDSGLSDADSEKPNS